MKKIPVLLKKFTLTFTTALGLSVACVSAQTDWNGSGDGTNWSDVSNWSSGLPAPSGTVATTFGNAPVDAAVNINVDTTANLGSVTFSNTGSRTYTFSGSPIYFTTTGATNRLQTADTAGVQNITFNNNLILGSSTLYVGHSTASSNRFSTITFNGDILQDGGPGARNLHLDAPTVIINGNNQATLTTILNTSELIVGSSTALSGGVYNRAANVILSLRSDTTLGGSYAWNHSGSTAVTSIRISEIAPSSADRTLTMSSRIGGFGTIKWIDNVNSTGKLILELGYNTGVNQNVNLVSNDNAIIRFIQSANTTYTGIISGTGEVQKKVGTGTTTLTATNTYTGNTIIDTGTLVLSNTGKLNFLIGDDGVNNQITGAGNVTLNGAFTFDLSGASSNFGDSWNIVDLASLNTVIFGGTFAVDGFTKTGNLWTLNSYQFDQDSGYLSVVPEPSTALLFLLGGGFMMIASRFRKAAPRKFHAHILLALLCLGQSAGAATPIIEWGGIMAPANSNLVFADHTDSDDTRMWKNTEEPLHVESRMYGILQNRSGTTTPENFAIARIVHDAGGDYLQIHGNGAEGNAIAGLIFFKPDVPAGSTISFDKDSSLEVNIKKFLLNPRLMRLAVLNNGVWYLSKYFETGVTEFKVSNAADTMWGAWEELKDAESLPEPPMSFTTSAAELTNIQAIGFYFSAAAYGNNGARLEIAGFNASALVTPNSN